MPNSSSLASTQSVEEATPTNRFRRGLAVCLVLTAFNVVVIATCAGTLYRATAYDTIEQVGVTLSLDCSYVPMAAPRPRREQRRQLQSLGRAGLPVPNAGWLC